MLAGGCSAANVSGTAFVAEVYRAQEVEKATNVQMGSPAAGPFREASEYYTVAGKGPNTPVGEKCNFPFTDETGGVHTGVGPHNMDYPPIIWT